MTTPAEQEVINKTLLEGLQKLLNQQKAEGEEDYKVDLKKSLDPTRRDDYENLISKPSDEQAVKQNMTVFATDTLLDKMFLSKNRKSIN